jgi:tetratricopeptide (TPR) repeat protein
MFFVALASGLGCSGSEDRIRHKAERRLFEADKVRSEWARSSNRENSRFVDRAIGEYRSIVDDFGDQTDIEGVKTAVITAQLRLAEIELQTGRILAALDDLEEAAKHEGPDVNEARVFAIYRAAEVAEAIGDNNRAVTLYERFTRDYLESDDLHGRESIPPNYLTTPLKLAQLARSADSPHVEAVWLQKAEALYGSLIETDTRPAIVKQAEFNLLTTYVQQQRWQNALALLDTLAHKYTDTSDQVGVRFMRANVYHTGLNDVARASDLYRELYETYPAAPEASSAMLLDAALSLRLGRVEQAETLYKQVLDDYGNRPQAVAEARWQIAFIAEERGDWQEASLHYKAITDAYPTTLYGLESPLRVAAGFARLGEPEAAAAAYQRALQGYQRIVDDHHPTATRLSAEDYILQVYVRQKQWDAAIQHLTHLVQKYPNHTAILQGNYVTAAAIYADELNDREKAIEMLRQCIDLYPESSTANVARERLDKLNTQK